MRVQRLVFGAWCLLLGSFCLPATSVAGPLTTRMTFSTDGGKTWSSAFPTVVSGAVVRVRASYTIVDSWENRDVIGASISCDRPFASQTQKRWSGGYQQREGRWWRASRGSDKYEWDLKTGRLPLGTSVFLLEIGYSHKDAKGKPSGRITDDQPFYVTVVK